jgi:predicted O-methyltransferase YrrM
MRVLPHFLLWRVGLVKAETQTTIAERDCLARHVAGKKCPVEIGVWHGVTTSRLRTEMAADAVLFAVDPYPAGRLGFSAQRYIAYKEVAKVRNGSIRWIRSRGVQAARDYLVLNESRSDFVFIDGDHTYPGLQDDWEAWSPLVAVNGIVALHDSCSCAAREIDDAGSAIFTREVILRDARFELLETVDTLTVLRRRMES